MVTVESSIGISLMSHREVIDMSTLKRLREDAGWTAAKLASSAGVSLSTINRMESGKEKYAVSRLIANQVLFALSERLGRKITIESVENLVLKETVKAKAVKK